jgi:CheY-like chemotaxis protein/HPt (histidine-containing phosphotransfer) domain-containing protein/anti-sigma regulatory factor (Ser/Thr protein kinase)
MVGVASMLELLAQTPLDADQRLQIDIVQSSARSLLQIIGDILDFSKIEAGKLEINPAPVDLRQFVHDCTNNFLATASAKGLALDYNIDERVGAAHLADALRLRQILGNFLSNAVKFTEHGKVQVRLERLAVQEQRELLALRVRDSGIGISAEDQVRLFQPFTQTMDGGARYQDSTGLGLSICRRLAELMGGEITLESQLGLGTTLSLILRLAPADPALIPRTVAAAPAIRAAPDVAEAEREGSLILLADDHPTNRAVIKRQINQLGYACETANDGEAAWQLWKSGRFALLLTDLHMPRRDGYALAEAIRADEQRRGRARAPVIALSATVSAEGVERSRAAGIDDFLAKPAPLAVLANMLQRYLPLQRFASGATNPAVATNPAQDRELIADFLRSTREDLVAMRAALANGDAEAVAREAHRIKGASRLIDANGLADCAARIEAAARASNLNPVDGGIVELEEEVNKLAAANATRPT